MKFSWFGMIALTVVMQTVKVYGQDCTGPEQAAFNYFMADVNAQRADIQKKKFVFDGLLKGAHSEFLNNKSCFTADEFLFLDVNASAIMENMNDGDSVHHISKICIKDAWRDERFVPNRVKKDVMKLDIFKATPVDNRYYVHLRLRDLDVQEDFFFEVDSEQHVLRWCSFVIKL